MSRYDITFPDRLFRPETSVIKFSSCFLAQFFNPSDQRGLLKTEKPLDQVEFYWKASGAGFVRECERCPGAVSGDINKGYFLYQICILFSRLIFLCSCRIPYSRASAVGGQPGT